MHTENGYYVLDSREESSMVSTWTVYLCYSAGENKPHRLSLCGYEGLADTSDYYDDEEDEYTLPDEIGGKRVVGMEDDMVIGGVFDCYTGELVEFDDPKGDEVIQWLKEHEWDVDDCLRRLRDSFI